MSDELPQAYIDWVRRVNVRGNIIHFPILPSDSPGYFWILFPGGYVLTLWSDIPSVIGKIENANA